MDNEDFFLKTIREFEAMCGINQQDYHTPGNLSSGFYPRSVGYNLPRSSEASDGSFLDTAFLKKRLEKRGIDAENVEIVENGLYGYMERIIKDIFSVFEVSFFFVSIERFWVL